MERGRFTKEFKLEVTHEAERDSEMAGIVRGKRRGCLRRTPADISGGGQDCCLGTQGRAVDNGKRVFKKIHRIEQEHAQDGRKRRETIYRLIQSQETGLSIRRRCQIARVSASAYYACCQGRKVRHNVVLVL